jgi:hypothetical protein
MRSATNIGVTSAILLIGALISGALGTMYDTASLWKYLTALCAIVGLLLVVWAAVLVIAENHTVQQLMEVDMSDLPELGERTHDEGTARARNSAPPMPRA